MKKLNYIIPISPFKRENSAPDLFFMLAFSVSRDNSTQYGTKLHILNFLFEIPGSYNGLEFPYVINSFCSCFSWAMFSV